MTMSELDRILKEMRAGTRQNAIHGCQGCADSLLEDAADVVERLQHRAKDMLEALTLLEAALRKDSRDKSILSDTVEYHLDGQTMGYAINKVRAAIAKAEGRS